MSYFMVDIEADTGITRKTVGLCVMNLVAKNLAHRPEGEKRGATATSLGQSTLASINSA